MEWGKSYRKSCGLLRKGNNRRNSLHQKGRWWERRRLGNIYREHWRYPCILYRIFSVIRYKGSRIWRNYTETSYKNKSRSFPRVGSINMAYSISEIKSKILIILGLCLSNEWVYKILFLLLLLTSDQKQTFAFKLMIFQV